MNYGFDGKVALVTGASGGIGRASAIAFAASGARVVVSDVNEAGGSETVDMIVAAGGQAVFQRCDVANAGDVKALVQRAVSEYGRLDCALTMPASTIWAPMNMKMMSGPAPLAST